MSNKKKNTTHLSMGKQEKLLKDNTVVITIVLMLAAFYYGLCLETYLADYPRVNIIEAISQSLSYLSHPAILFPIRCDLGTPFFLSIMIFLINIMFYFVDKMKLHYDVHTIKGSTEWATISDIVHKYADFSKKNDYKSHPNNILMSENVYVSLNTNKHFHALNTMIIGTTGSGKSRYFLKPNLMAMNTSYVITDPKGDILKECGEMLRRNGYNVRVFDILNMGNCDTYNPLKYCFKESDIKKVVQAFIKNTDSTGGKGGGHKDPFWDDSMNAFLCACIGLLTMKPEGSDLPYCQIPEIMGGDCYAPVFANICELTRMASAKWDKSCGIELLDGVQLGDGKNATANASKLAAIFENLRIYEAKRQETDPAHIRKPYCLREWENFRIAPEKTSTTILMTVAVRLDSFNIEQVRNLTSSDTINLTEFGKKRDALFLIIPPTDRTYNFLIAFLYTQLFDILYRTGAEGSIGSKILKLRDGELVKYFPKEEVESPDFEKKVKAIRHANIVEHIIQEYDVPIEEQESKTPILNCVQKIVASVCKKSMPNSKHIVDGWYDIIAADGTYISRRPTKKAALKYVKQLQHAKLQKGKPPKLPYHVRFLMDEFANIGELPEFKDKLATVRGYDISCTIILQTITQLKGMYPDDYEVVDANCPFTIFLGGDENTNNEYLSKKLGTTTVKGLNVSLDNKNKANNSLNVDGRELLKPEELGRMDYNNQLVLIYGEQPIMDQKIDYTSLPNYNQTTDYASDVDLSINTFHRPNTSDVTPALTWKPIKASAIPNTFELTEQVFMQLFNVTNMEEATTLAFNSIERNSFDVSDSSAMAF